VFAYATDRSHLPDWQVGVVSVREMGDAPLAVGSKAAVNRRVGPRELHRTEEVTKLDPPRAWAYRSVGGPVTVIATYTIEPLDGGKRSRVKLALDLEGHGVGRLLIPLVVRRQTRKQVPATVRRLKERLERRPA
jgi:hypothetical protein